jgi:trk system potassium uptake protein TrkH
MLSPRLFRALGWCWLVVGLSAAPFGLWLSLTGEGALARGFAASALMGAFAGGFVLAATRDAGRAAGAVAGLRLALAAWTTTPIVACWPLIAAMDDPLRGPFETVSALTTTGASALPAGSAHDAILLWRGALQAWGGFGSLILATTVFAALDARGPGLRRSTLLTVEDDDLFTNFGRVFRRLGALYGGLIVAATAVYLAFGLEPAGAATLAMAALSTGGMGPTGADLSLLGSLALIVVTAGACLIGAWNLAFLYEIASRGRASRTPFELRPMVFTAAAAALLAGLGGGAALIPPAFFEAVFAVTTGGFHLGDSTALAPVTAVMLALIGGSAISTSGGMKITRVLLLLRRALDDLSHLAFPSAAARLRFGGRRASEKAMASVSAYALAFPAAFGAGVMLLGFAGAEFDTAWKAAGAALANAGPVSGVDYGAQSSAVLTAMLPLMVLGRLEVLAGVAALYVLIRRD